MNNAKSTCTSSIQELFVLKLKLKLSWCKRCLLDGADSGLGLYSSHVWTPVLWLSVLLGWSANGVLIIVVWWLLNTTGLAASNCVIVFLSSRWWSSNPVKFRVEPQKGGYHRISVNGFLVEDRVGFGLGLGDGFVSKLAWLRLLTVHSQTPLLDASLYILPVPPKCGLSRHQDNHFHITTMILLK